MAGTSTRGKAHFLKLTLLDARKRWLIFGVWTLLSCLLFAKPIRSLVQLASQDDTASHILLVPFISGWLLYLERKESLPNGHFAPLPSMAFLVPSIFVALFSRGCVSCTPKDHLSILVLSLILLLVAGFILILGTAKAKASSFAFAFLLFAIPIPDIVLNKIIYGLQAGSAAIAEVFFNLSGAPVLREGFIFRLPKLSIEVAQECSGIRSSLALLILAVLVAHFSFRPLWKKLVFLLAGLFMMLLKNGIRIATLTLLANYVDPIFLYGKIHHQGGIVFFLIGLGLLLPLYGYLRKGENTTASVDRMVV